jgi:hypothetical protein
MRFKGFAAALGLAAGVAMVATPAFAARHASKSNKFLINFVRAYNQCTTSGAVGTHNAPFTFPTCATVPSSTTLGFGVKGKGTTVGVVKVNKDKPIKHATDVTLLTKFSDVRGAGGDGFPFDGSLAASSNLRITDDYNGDSTPETMVDLPLPFPVKCGTAASPPIGSGKCLLKSTVNTIYPGGVVPGHDANVEMGQIKFSGPDSTVVFVGGIELP